MKPQIRDGASSLGPRKMALIARETPVIVQILGAGDGSEAGWTTATLRPYAEHLLGTFGPDRLIWGSDWPVLNMNGDYDSWWSAARALIPAEHQAAVFGANAARFYGL